MINLDEKFHNYLENDNKFFRIDGVNEPLKGYGYHCDGNEIKGYYVLTENYKLFYNLEERFLYKEELPTVTI